MTELAIDLASRWRRARHAALCAVVPDVDEVETEEDHLFRALERAPEDVLRLVFEHSQRLGEGFRRFYKLDLPITELAGFLPLLGVPCLAREWTRVADEHAYIAEHAGCAAPSQHAHACDYWREAIEGLVLGMTGAVRHGRHASRGHGDPSCIDLLYIHPQSPLRFGPIPVELQAGLESIRRVAQAFDGSTKIRFLGLSEGVLHYQTQTLGEGGGVRVSTLVERGVARRFPGLATRDVTARPVFVDSPS
jgi:hypothetical protein